MGANSLPGSRCSRPRACAAGSPKRKTIPPNELYAVALNVPAGDGVFTYRIAPELGAAETGRRVVVPLGRRTETGIVLGPGEAQGEVRDAVRLLDDAPLLPADVVALARWAAGHYLSPLGPALKATLPPGMDIRDALVPRLTEAGRALLDAGQLDLPGQEEAARRALRRAGAGANPAAAARPGGGARLAPRAPLGGPCRGSARGLPQRALPPARAGGAGPRNARPRSGRAGTPGPRALGRAAA